MRNRTSTRIAIATAAVAGAAIALAATATAAPVPRTGAGANAAAITPARDQYRIDLGGGNTAGPNGAFGGLRREINWDGVPEPNSEPNLFPANFFNNRGVNFTGAPAFMVSNNVPSRFNTLNATYSAAFTAFTAEKLFTPIGTTTYDVDFTVPGTTTPASARGFGAVFADVDSAASTRIDLIGLDGQVLFSLPVPASGASDDGFSFAGVTFNAGERIAKARIITGTTAITNTPGTSPADITQGGTGDVVVLDDFLYGEPTAIPSCAGRLATIAGDDAPNDLRGTTGDDVIYGGAGRDELKGLGGKDRICGNDGKDTLSGGAGKDRLLGGKGKDRLFGGKGRDVLKGGKGKDKTKQ